MIKRLALFLLSIILLITNTGCWNNRDLAEISISTALGIDKTEDGKIMVSVQIVKPSALRVGKEGVNGEKKGFVVVSNTADTVFGALREMLSKVNKKIFYSSSQVIVIGESMAREGVCDYIDFILRDHETPFKSLVAVAKGITAKEVLEHGYELTNVPGAFLRDTLNNVGDRGFSKKVMLIEVARELATQGKELSIGTILKEGGTTVTEGIAVFAEGKMVGLLDKYESRGFMFAQGLVKSTIIEIQDSKQPEKLVAVEIQKTSATKKVELGSDNKPKFTLNVYVYGTIGEQHIYTDSENEFINSITEKCNIKIKNEIQKSIEKTQKEYASDIFGFGQKVFDKYPDYWISVRDEWNSKIYTKLEVNVVVNTKLMRTGLLDKPIKVK